MKRILIVEDQSLVRAAMRELILISEPDANIKGASSFDEAVSLFKSDRFEYAFLDIDLKSSLSGKDLLTYIRHNEISTKAIMLSGLTSKDLVLECLNMGACGFISKYCEIEDVFTHAIQTILAGGLYIPLTRAMGDIELQTNHKAIESHTLADLGVTGRSVEVLSYLCKGHPNKTIARKMNVEEGTIRKDYVPKLFRIFNVSRRIELLIEVSRLGITVPDFD
jgi:two-component system nitrate/nitrite response regulator NarL